jgi:hypothetical protein
MGNKARVWLYKEGNECSTITGGWSGKNFGTYGGSNYAIKNADNLDFGDNGNNYGYGGFRTNNTISLSQFSTIYIDWQQYSFSLNVYGGTGKSGSADSTFFYTSSSALNDGYSYNNSRFAGINNSSGTNNTTRRTDSSSMDAVNNSTKYYLGMAGMSGYINPDTVKTRTYNIYMDSRKDIITVSNQNNTQLTLILDNLSNMITFTKIEILANNKVIKTYNENLSTIVYNFDSSIMEWGDSTISIKATYTQGDGISNVVDKTSSVKYQKNLVTSHYFRIIEQNENLVTMSSNDIEDYPLYINRIDILTNDRILQTYTENLSEITYEFNKDLMDWGNNEISIHVTYTEKTVVKLYKVILDIEYKKEVEIEELDPIVDLPSTSTLKDVIQRFSVIESTNNAIKNNLKNLLESKGFEVGDTPRLSSMVKIVNELSNNNSAEITEYINRITELEEEINDNKSKIKSVLTTHEFEDVEDIDNLSDLIDMVLTLMSAPKYYIYKSGQFIHNHTYVFHETSASRVQFNEDHIKMFYSSGNVLYSVTRLAIKDVDVTEYSKIVIDAKATIYTSYTNATVSANVHTTAGYEGGNNATTPNAASFDRKLLTIDVSNLTGFYYLNLTLYYSDYYIYNIYMEK